MENMYKGEAFTCSREEDKVTCCFCRCIETFIFVEEGTLRDQVERSMYYELTLEQRWEQIFCRQKKKNNCDNQGNLVLNIDLLLEKEQVYIGESKAVWNDKNVVDGVIGLRVKVMEENE